MQDFLHANQDDVQDDIERYKRMISTDKELYFDVHQIESISDFYIEKGLYDKASHVLQIGMKQHPLASSLKAKYAGILADNGQLDEAYELLLEIAPLEENNYEVFITLGWILLQKDALNQALKHFRKAIKVSFDDEEEVLLEIGFNLNQYDAHQEALEFLERLVHKYPHNPSGLFECAYAYDKIGDFYKSIETYEQLIELNPFAENGWYNLGILYNKTDNYIKAGEAYEFTLAINPLHSEAHFNRGNSLSHAGHFDDAIDAYIEHISLSKDIMLSYQYIAECWEQTGDYDMAVRFYQLVIKHLPNNADAWQGLGTCLMEKENFEGGLQAIDQAISINPVCADYWFAHARCLFELEKPMDACRSLENGLNIDPEELTGWIELLKLKILSDTAFDINEYLIQINQKHQSSVAIKYLSAIICFKYLEEENIGLEYLREAYSEDKQGMLIIDEDYPEISNLPQVQKLISISK